AVLGAGGPDRVRHRADLREHTGRRAGLLRTGAGHLRWLHHVRLPADTDLDGHQLRAVPGRVDLPRHPERVPVLPADLLRRAGLAGRTSVARGLAAVDVQDLAGDVGR